MIESQKELYDFIYNDGSQKNLNECTENTWWTIKEYIETPKDSKGQTY